MRVYRLTASLLVKTVSVRSSCFVTRTEDGVKKQTGQTAGVFTETTSQHTGNTDATCESHMWWIFTVSYSIMCFVGIYSADINKNKASLSCCFIKMLQFHVVLLLFISSSCFFHLSTLCISCWSLCVSSSWEPTAPSGKHTEVEVFLLLTVIIQQIKKSQRAAFSHQDRTCNLVGERRAADSLCGDLQLRQDHWLLKEKPSLLFNEIILVLFQTIREH